MLNYLLRLDLSSLWGIGYKTRQHLNKRAIFTIQQLRSCTLTYLKQHFGQKLGEVLYHSCRGIDPIDRRHQTKNRSIGNETTFADDEFDEQTILNHLLWLSHKTFNRMLDAGYETQTVAVKVRSSNFETQQIQKTFDSAITSVEQLYACVKELFFIRWQNRQALRLVGVSLCNLERCRQLSLFNEQGEKQRQIEQIMQKFKKQGVLVAKASLLTYEQDWRQRQAGERPVFDGLVQSLNDQD